MKRYFIGIALSGVLLFLILQGIKIFSGQKNEPAQAGTKNTALDKLQDGDIVFQLSLSAQSEAIQLATHSAYSHCGIVYKINNNYFVFEAVEPVKLTPLDEWIDRGKGGRFAAKRLIMAGQVFTQPIIEKMKQVGDRFKGSRYDPFFEWTDDRLYCSELVWKIYKEVTGFELGKLQQLKDFDLTSDPVKQKLKERYGVKIPLQEMVISPASIFESPLLKTVE